MWSKNPRNNPFRRDWKVQRHNFKDCEEYVTPCEFGRKANRELYKQLYFSFFSSWQLATCNWRFIKRKYFFSNNEIYRNGKATMYLAFASCQLLIASCLNIIITPSDNWPFCFWFNKKRPWLVLFVQINTVIYLFFLFLPALYVRQTNGRENDLNSDV